MFPVAEIWCACWWGEWEVKTDCKKTCSIKVGSYLQLFLISASKWQPSWGDRQTSELLNPFPTAPNEWLQISSPERGQHVIGKSN